MSTVSRLISGSVASWARIGVTLLSQLALVPLYLTYWTIEVYGVWLTIQALITVISILDFQHQEYLGFEFLKYGKENPEQISNNLYSGILIGILISVFQIFLIIVFLLSGILPYFLGESALINKNLIDEAGIVLILQGITWLTCSSSSGLLSRALDTFGFYPRMGWWRFFIAIISSIVPIIPIMNGAGLLVTGLVTAIAIIITTIPQYIDMFRLLRKVKIVYKAPSLKLGFKNFYASLTLTGKGILEIIRQQGIRLIISPLTGPAGMAAFATMRTGANVTLQGLNTITYPLMPDLMRFLNHKDQLRSEAAFATIWIVVVAIMAPVVVILQVIMEWLFYQWTRGTIRYDPLLFATLSISILIYAIAQPAMSVIRGNNILKPQFIFSAIAGAIVIVGMYIFVPLLGIAGGGVALLAGEVISYSGYKIFAKKWFSQNGLNWPTYPSRIAATSVWIAALANVAIIWFPQSKLVILPISLALLFWNLWRYWQVIPTLAIQHAKHFLIKKIKFKKVLSV